MWTKQPTKNGGNCICALHVFLNGLRCRAGSGSIRLYLIQSRMGANHPIVSRDRPIVPSFACFVYFVVHSISAEPLCVNVLVTSNPVKIIQQLSGRLVAVFGPFGQHVEDDVLEKIGDRQLELLGLFGIRLPDLADDFG